MLLRIVRHFSRRNTGTKLLKKNKKNKFFLKKTSQNIRNEYIAKQIKTHKRHQYHGLWIVFRRNLESRPIGIPMPFSDKVHIEV